MNQRISEQRDTGLSWDELSEIEESVDTHWNEFGVSMTDNEVEEWI